MFDRAAPSVRVVVPELSDHVRRRTSQTRCSIGSRRGRSRRSGPPPRARSLSTVRNNKQVQVGRSLQPRVRMGPSSGTRCDRSAGKTASPPPPCSRRWFAAPSPNDIAGSRRAPVESGGATRSAGRWHSAPRPATRYFLGFPRPRRGLTCSAYFHTMSTFATCASRSYTLPSRS